MDEFIAHVGPGPAALAVDVGGTTIKYSLVAADGSVGAATRVPTPRGANPAALVVDAVALLFDQTRRDHPHLEVSALGAAVPGLVDEDAGIGLHSENLGWRDAPLRRLLEDRIDARVSLVHDVRAAGAAEARIGAGAGFANVITVVIGTGVSAAIWSDGRPLRGRGYAGEIGHMRVSTEDVPCSCGGVGCLEAIASAAAIESRYARLGGAEPIAGARDVIRLALQGDPVANGVWSEALDALASGLAAVTAVAAPEVIVIGGGLSQAGDRLLEPLTARLAERVGIVPVPRLVRARFGADAGAVGAALSTRDAIAPGSRDLVTAAG
ncbi:hypothetical protein ASD65_11235 [Microbacterium sp. Root61]|uniref:ROK family protein n=1 Tax=Microbacterium sp. Root61 TaxID=1736570 RepID=UPI000701E6C1|nr:ROK family protein [Microbacterium sp. Root61]KRA24938.1 hypothetical protein ASD65_11235 [Microbacterium sp. Root61]